MAINAFLTIELKIVWIYSRTWAFGYISIVNQ